MDEPTPPSTPPPPAVSEPQPGPTPPSPTATTGPGWKSALVVTLIAAGVGAASFAGIVNNPNASDVSIYFLGFILALFVGAAGFTLLVYRLRNRGGDAYPTLVQCVVMGAAGAALSLAGCLGFAATMESAVPLSVILAVGFVVGGLLALGGGMLLLFRLGRMLFGYR